MFSMFQTSPSVMSNTSEESVTSGFLRDFSRVFMLNTSVMAMASSVPPKSASVLSMVLSKLCMRSLVAMVICFVTRSIRLPNRV